MDIEDGGFCAVGSSLAARTQRSPIARATAFLALILIPSLGSAAIYKCTAQDGGITYTDAPCPADTTTQYIDPAAPSWLNESSQTMTTTPELPDAKSQSQPETIAILCANDEFKVWLAQGSATFLAGTGRPNSEIYRDQQPLPKGSPPPGCGGDDSAKPLKRILGQELPPAPILSRNLDEPAAHAYHANNQSLFDDAAEAQATAKKGHSTSRNAKLNAVMQTRC